MIYDTNLIIGVISILVFMGISVTKTLKRKFLSRYDIVFNLIALCALGSLTYYAYATGAYAFMIMTIVWIGEIIYFGFVKKGTKKEK